MRIWLEDGLSLRNKTGIGNYTILLNKLLLEANVDFMMPKKHFLEKIKNHIVRRFLYFLWLNLILPFQLYFSKCNMLWTTSIMLPFIKFPNIKYISTIHDIESFIYPQFMTKEKKLYADVSVISAVINANIIVTVSNTIKDEIIQNFNIPEHNIKILYNSFNESFLDSNINSNILERLRIKHKKYILSVATLLKRKNIISLINAFNLIQDKYPDLILVLVGNLDKEKFSCNYKNIILTGYLESDNDLINLYQNSLMYVFPSVYEGFGIPIIEAQAAKVPVICSNIQVFREVANNAALFTDKNHESIALEITKLIRDKNIQEELISNGLINIKRYTQNIIKEQLISILKELNSEIV